MLRPCTSLQRLNRVALAGLLLRLPIVANTYVLRFLQICTV